MTSHKLVSGGMLSASCRANCTSASSFWAFRVAMSSAFCDMSMAETRHVGKSRASVVATHPLPVPMSSNVQGVPVVALSLQTCTIQAHNSSVSGRGMSTPCPTSNVRPANSARPNTYCTGTPCTSLSIILWSRRASSCDNCVTLSA